MSEQEQLTQTIRSSVSPECTCGAGNYESMDACDCEEIEPTDAPTLAAALLNSPWLAEHDASIRADTLRAAAGMYPALTRDLVSRASVKRWLMDLAKEETE